MPPNVERRQFRIAVWLEGVQEFDTVAFMFFLLSTHNIQHSFRFFFPDPPGDLKFDDAHQKMLSGSAVYKAPYDLHLFLVARPIEGNLFFLQHGIVALITTAGWERNFAPPSLFEYLSHSIICCTLYRLSNNIHNHADFTVGCHFDYTRIKANARISIALGTICDEHKDIIERDLGKQILDDALAIFSLDWIGDLEDPGSIADKMKDFFKHDLKRDSGYKKGFFERVQSNLDSLWFDFMKETFRGIILIVIAYLLFKFGLTRSGS